MTALMLLAVLPFWTGGPVQENVPAPQASRYDLGVRLKRLEAQWLEATPERRSEAIAPLNAAVASFFGSRFDRACRSLDEATAALESRKVSPEDAIALRAERPIADEVIPLAALAYLVYDPGQPVEATIQTKPVILRHGHAVRVEQPSAPGRTVWSATSGGRRLSVVFERPTNLDKRLQSLASSDDPLAKAYSEALARAVSAPMELETELPASEMLEWTPSKGRTGEIPIARQNRTWLRASIPSGWESEGVLVVAVHGAGGSENLFFEGYGAGLGKRLADQRRWAFVAPRAGGSAVQDAIDWCKAFTGVSPKRVLVMGHSMGGGVALRSGGVSPKPTAVALFAPAAVDLPANLTETPIFFAVGDQEMAMLRTSAANLSAKVQSNKRSVSRTYSPCEHLMIVADALPDAYRFFDQVLAISSGS